MGAFRPGFRVAACSASASAGRGAERLSRLGAATQRRGQSVGAAAGACRLRRIRRSSDASLRRSSALLPGLASAEHRTALGARAPFDPADYLGLLRETAVQIRSADDDAEIVLAALAPNTEAGVRQSERRRLSRCALRTGRAAVVRCRGSAALWFLRAAGRARRAPPT